MAVIETWYNQDLQEPVKVHYLDGSMFSHNGNGNRIGVHVFNNGSPVTLAGTVSGYVVTADGTTVPCMGSRSGNNASILIPAAAYQPGAIFITVFLTDGSTVTTLASVATNVLTARTGNQVSPGSVVTDWTQTINAAMQSVENAAENLGGIVATPYASLTFPVPLGEYTYYNGNLYRCISPIATSEEFTAAHWTQVRLGDDVSDLNSALSKTNDALIDSSYEESELTLSLYSDNKAVTTAGSMVTADGYSIYYMDIRAYIGKRLEIDVTTNGTYAKAFYWTAAGITTGFIGLADTFDVVPSNAYYFGITTQDITEDSVYAIKPITDNVANLNNAVSVIEQSAYNIDVNYDSFKNGYYRDNQPAGSVPVYVYDSGFVCALVSMNSKNVKSVTIKNATMFSCIPFKNGLSTVGKVTSVDNLLNYEFDQVAFNFQNSANTGGYNNLLIRFINESMVEEEIGKVDAKTSFDKDAIEYESDILISGYYFDNNNVGTAIDHRDSNDFKCCLIPIYTNMRKVELTGATLYDYILYKDGKTAYKQPGLKDLVNIPDVDFDQIGFNFQNSANTSGYDNLNISVSYQGEIAYRIEQIEYAEEKGKYAGKTLTVIGDSITAGYGVTKPYPTWLGEKLGLRTVTNLGVNGARLSGMAVVVNSATISDVNLVFGGTNDFALDNLPLGELYSLSNNQMIPNMDTSTFYGVVNTVCVNAIKRFKGKRFFLVTPIHREAFSGQPSDRQPNTAGLYLYQYIDAMEKSTEFWGVQLINLYKSFMYNPNIPEIKSAYFQTNDGLHPNETGHEMLADCLITMAFN